MRKKLLLADDSITIQKVVGIIFSSEEYGLTIVDNGDAALAKARESIPDVLLLDAVMPGKTGYEVCEEIRRDPSLKEIPILLMTGAFEPFDESKARECGADDFISKPFESQHLVDKVLSLADLAAKRSAGAPTPVPAGVEFTLPPVMEAVPPPQPLAVPPQSSAFAPPPPVESFDFFTIEEEPAPLEAPRAVPPTTPAAGVVAPPPAESFDFFAVEEEPAPAVVSPPVHPAPQPAPPLAESEVARPVPPPREFRLEVVEATSDDDLWGAFELEDLAVTETAEAAPESFEIETVGAATDDAYEASIVLEEGGAVFPSEPEVAVAPQKFEPVEETAFSFADLAEPVPQATTPEVIPFDQGGVFEDVTLPPIETEPVSGDFFAETGGGTPQVAGTDFGFQFTPEEEAAPTAAAPAAPAAPPAAQEFDFEFVPEEEPVPVFETPPPVAPAAVPEPVNLFAPAESFEPPPEPVVPVVPAAPVPPPAVPVAPAAPLPAVGGELSEEQLTALVAKISRDILEKIAWEVVPDLAERIIKEEIRKIKEGA